jgi:pimeloyl-ACP methyl ester carboxylesterase
VLRIIENLMSTLVIDPPAASGAPNATPAATGQHVELPGVKLCYTDTGGAGVPVVLLHANTFTSAEWGPQVQGLSAAGYRVIAFDRRGWGRSEAIPATGPQPGTVAEDLDGLVRYLQLPKFHLVGIAGGGFVAIDFAAWRPEQLRSLVIAASNGQLQEKRMDEFSARIDVPGLREPGRRVYRELGVAYRAANPEGTARFIEVEHAAQQAGAPAQPMRTPNTFAKVATIPLPAMILAGGADLIAPPALMKEWASHLPRYEFQTIGDAGHSIAWERPGTFNDRVLEFIARH